MGIQINTQPQVFTSLSSTAISAQNLTAVRGIFTSVSASAISAAKFTGDGSGLTGVVGVAAGVTSVNGLTGTITNVAMTSGANFTGNVTSPSLSATSISAVNYLSGGVNFTSIFGSKTSIDNTFNIVSANSADWTIGKTLSTSGGRIGGNVTIAGNLTANYITTLSGTTFVNTIFTTTSALCVLADPINVGPAFYVGAKGSGDIASFYDTDQNVEVLHVGGANGNFPNVGIKVSNPTQTLTVSGTVSALSTAWFGDVISNNDLTAKQATFTTSVSSPVLSSNVLILSGYPITPVTTVYSVASSATSTYTLALSDNNNTITLTLGTSGIVLISNSISYPVGFQTNIIQLSTGRVTLSAASPLTLKNDLSSYKTYQQYSAATLINLGSVWVCYGSLSS